MKGRRQLRITTAPELDEEPKDCSGGIRTCLTQATLIEHFKGHRWVRVPSPDPDRANQLNDVSADSPTDV